MVTEKYLDSKMANMQSFILFIVFMVLKLTEVIFWSWWYVFMPVLIPAVIFFVLLVVKMAVAYCEANKE